MADVNITLKRYDGSDWITMHPATELAQIIDATATGRNLAKLNIVGAERFIKIGTCSIAEHKTQQACEGASGVWDSSGIALLDSAGLLAAIDAAPSQHDHEIAGITGLGTALAGKANLEDNLIKSSEIPEFLFSGLRFVESISSNTSLESLKSTYLTQALDKEKAGGYFIATAPVAITFTTETMAYGDDGFTLADGIPTQDSENTSGLTLEIGDWLVYQGNSEWGIVNNTYRVASQNFSGIVSISNTGATLRSQLSTTSSGLQVMSEKTVRDVMKDILYASSEPGTGQVGDLLFLGSFS